MILSAPPITDRLSQLRAALEAEGLDGFIVPRTDQYLGEYVSADAERLAWLTGFTGSAGTALVLGAQVILFVDGRYTLQAAAEVAGTEILVRTTSDGSLHDYLAATLAPKARLAFDPWLHSADQALHLRRATQKAGALLIAVSDNPIDRIWTDRPAGPLAPIALYPEAFAGCGWREKLAVITDSMDKADAAVLTDPSSVAWLLNIRGRDVPFTPLPLGRAVVYRDGPCIDVFFDPVKVGPDVAHAFGAEVRFLAPDALSGVLDRLGAGKARVRVEAAHTPAAVIDRLEVAGAQIDRGSDPCALLRACKNAAELAGMRAAHRRDGAALVRLLAWASQYGTGHDELAVVDKAFEVRARGQYFQGLSFATIAGFGPNGAIVHYRSTPATSRVLEPGSLLLIDSGAQYLDGTTDATRTIAIGPAGAEQRVRYTQVLKGNIAVSRAVFPAGTSGSQLDVLARLALWADGVDYEHGTGHGVGSYLSVHEGPQRISKAGNSVALKPGMVLSNEPGYYKTGHYGIRIENLLAVTEVTAPRDADLVVLGFEVLTLAPFDRTLIDVGLLTAEERAWIDAYHARVAVEIGPLVDGPAGDWLAHATAPL